MMCDARRNNGNIRGTFETDEPTGTRLNVELFYKQTARTALDEGVLEAHASCPNQSPEQLGCFPSSYAQT